MACRVSAESQSTAGWQGLPGTAPVSRIGGDGQLGRQAVCTHFRGDVFASGFFEGVRDGVAEAESLPLADCLFPGLRATAFARRVENGRVQPFLDGVYLDSVAVRGGGADEPRGAANFAVDSRNRGQTEQALGGSRSRDQLTAELKLLAERLASAVGVAGQERDQSRVPVDRHPYEGIVEFADDRDR